MNNINDINYKYHSEIIRKSINATYDIHSLETNEEGSPSAGRREVLGSLSFLIESKNSNSNPT